MKTPRELHDEVALLKLVFIRNRNQHHSQVWWKYFSIFMRRAEQLAASKRLDPATSKFLYKKLIPKLWRALHTALAQGAFLTITFAVMAGVARISCLIEPALQRPAPVPIPQADIEDLGEMVAQEDILPDLPNLNPSNPVAGSSSEPAQVKKKLKKKKKKLDAIDAIFG